MQWACFSIKTVCMCSSCTCQAPSLSESSGFRLSLLGSIHSMCESVQHHISHWWWKQNLPPKLWTLTLLWQIWSVEQIPLCAVLTWILVFDSTKQWKQQSTNVRQNILNVQFSHKGLKRNRVHVDKGNAKEKKRKYNKQSISLRISVSRNILFDKSHQSLTVDSLYLQNLA
jgi:hypothetical protein